MAEAPSRPFWSATAVAAPPPDASVPGHFGDPFGEQRRLEAGAAVVDLSQLEAIEVTGADAASFLNNLLSQKLDTLRTGDSAEALLLDAAGHLEGDFAVVRTEAGFLLLTDPGAGERLAGWLDSMRFMMRVDVSVVTQSWAAIGYMAGGVAAAQLDDSAAWVWRDPWHDGAPGGVSYAAIDTRGWQLRLAVVKRAERARAARLLADQGVAVSGMAALESLRIAAGRPRFARERDEKSLPHEYGWLRSAVHLTKGCYRGQETVAKVHNLGHPPRRLVRLELDGSDAVYPEPGDAVLLAADATPVGTITSVGNHYEWGPIALAVVKRATGETAPLVVSHEGAPIAATQTVLVPSDAGAVAGDTVRALRSARRSV